MSGTKCGRHTQARYSLSGSTETEIKWNENIMSNVEEFYNCYSSVEKCLEDSWGDIVLLKTLTSSILNVLLL